MSPSSVKLLIVAIDQISLWAQIAARAKDYPDMTAEQADALVTETQEQAKATSDDWRAYSDSNKT